MQSPHGEKPRHAVASGIDFAERELPPAKFEGYLIAPALERKVEKVGQVHES
jgi:hypothetical protein